MISKGLVVRLPLRLEMQFYVVPYFKKQRGCKARKFANIHTTYHILEHMILHVEMAKAAVPKLECAIPHWRLHQIGRIRLVHLYKKYFVEVSFA